MTDENIFEEMKGRNDEYLEKIKLAHATGKLEDSADLFDDYGQFLCDSARTLLIASKYLESLEDESPEQKAASRNCVNLFRDYYATLTATYKKLDEYQRKGVIPTNLPNLF